MNAVGQPCSYEVYATIANPDPREAPQILWNDAYFLNTEKLNQIWDNDDKQRQTFPESAIGTTDVPMLHPAWKELPIVLVQVDGASCPDGIVEYPNFEDLVNGQHWQLLRGEQRDNLINLPGVGGIGDDEKKFPWWAVALGAGLLVLTTRKED